MFLDQVDQNQHNLPFYELTQRIIGASFEVHKFLGNGFPEVIYQRALALEFGRLNISFKREIEKKLFYKDFQLIGKRRADFIVDDKVLVELKAVGEIQNSHIAQTLNYLKAFRYEIGLLINFGAPSLEFKRLILSSKR